MKKALALLLVLLMTIGLMVLAACEKQDATPAAESASPAANSETPAAPDPGTAAPAAPGASEEITEEMLKNSKPNEYIREKLDAGMEVLVGMVGFADVEIITVVFAGGVQQAVEELGCTFSITTAGQNVATLLTQIENYSTMGAALIFVVPPDAESIKDTVLAAQTAGSDVVVHGNRCDYDTIVERGDMGQQGYMIADLASQWISQEYPDAGPASVKAAVFGSSAMAVQLEKTNAMLDGLSKDARFDLVYTANDINNSVDGGFTALEEAFTYDSEIRVVLSFNTSPAIGFNNYLIAQPGIDLSEYAVFAGGSDSAFPELLEMASKNEAALRGYIAEAEATTYYIAETCVNALLDIWTAPYENLYSNVAWTESNFAYVPNEAL